MVEKILSKLVKVAYPNRSITVEKNGKHFFLIAHDNIGGNNYLLEKKYRYEDVIELNKLTGYNCGFGYCKELGPIAFIGIINSYFCMTSGYFKYRIHEYGTSKDDSEYYFEHYTEEEAKKVDNYIVYGYQGVYEVSNKVSIEKLNYMYDSRYIRKKNAIFDYDDPVLEMDYKLSGKYTFNEARILATGTKKDKIDFSDGRTPIQFAIIDDNIPIGIINLFEQYEDIKFRDVWEYGCIKPKTQNIRFISKNEAQSIDQFSLYIYMWPYNFKTKTYTIEKEDRTFDRRFELRLEDGKDYRINNDKEE